MIPITLQDILTAAWQAFIVERRPPACDPISRNCVYLTEDGRKCAIGLCIPDGHPAQHSYATFGSLVHAYPGLFDDQIKSLTPDERDDIQEALHDTHLDYDDGDQWRDGHIQDMITCYREVARKYNLILPEEDPA